MTTDAPVAMADGDDRAPRVGHRVQLMEVVSSAQAPGASQTLALALPEEHDLGAPAGRNRGAEFEEVCKGFYANAPLLHARAGVGRETDRHAGAP
jgi:hypothetical protein